MNKTIAFTAVVLLTMMAMGCTQPTDPDPVKVYLTGTTTYTCTAEVSFTIRRSDIYQWDGVGKFYTTGYTYYDGLVGYTGEVEVVFDETHDDEWIIDAGVLRYINDRNISSDFYIYQNDVRPDLDFTIETTTGFVGIRLRGAGDETIFTVESVEYLGNDTIQDGTGIWIRE